jgi:uncharacterized protein YndB with AHSA1/START domain
MSDERDLVSVSRVIDAPPEAIFALLADPSRHRDFDGSGTVGASKEQPERLRLGSKFGMSMKQGVSYSMVNEVVEFEENRRIAWAPHMKAFAWVSGGRVWRYELEPVDGGTRVTETWDITNEKSKVFVRAAGKKTRANMEATLTRLDELATKPA